MKAFDDIAALLASIIVLATVAVVLSRKSRTPGVLKSFFGGFSRSINAAQGA